MYFSLGSNNQLIILEILVALKIKRKDTCHKMDFKVY